MFHFDDASREQSLAVACACVFLTTAALVGCHSQPKAAAAAPPPPTVLFTKVVRRDVPLYVESVASLDGFVNADIRARVRGYLKTQEYREGGLVQANQRLFTIEDAEFRAAVAEARADLARARAAQQHSGTLLQRSQTLFQTGAASQQQIDDALASGADSEGQVASAQARLEQAELNLSYTQIRSPITGVAGLASVRVGNLVGQDGPTLLTTVSQIDPIRVTFPLSELDYVKYPERWRDLSRRDLRWAKQQFEKLEQGGVADLGDPGLELLLSDGSVYPHRGIVVTVGRQIDASTGTIQLQALVPNPDGFLRPGQFGRVRLRREHEGKDSLAVPDKALVLVQGTYSLGVVGDDAKVHLRKVEVGPSVAGTRLITHGISEGERVVVEGLQKISDGATVVAKPTPEQTASAEAPTSKASATN